MRINAIMAATLLASALMGCTDFKEWTYTADAPAMRTPVLAKRVVVPPVDDLRSHSNRDMGFFFVCFVPLMPYGTAHYDRPELGPMWQRKGVTPFNAAHDVGKAIAEELDHSGLFSQVVFSPDATGGDLVLNGDLTELRDDRWMSLYGLTFFFGDFLWLMGAPAGGTTHQLTLKLTLVERATGKTLWSETFSSCDKKTEWIYSMKHALRHPQLLKADMRQAIQSMEAALAK